MGTSVGPVKANTQIGGQYTQGVGYSSNPPSQANKQQHLLTISNMGGAGGGNSTYLDSSAMYNNQSNIYSIHTEIDRMPSSQQKSAQPQSQIQQLQAQVAYYRQQAEQAQE